MQSSNRNDKENIRSKYAPLLMIWLLIGVMLLMVELGLAEIIFVADIAMLAGAAFLFKPEIEKAMKKEPNNPLLKHESPREWLFFSTRLFGVSFVTSLLNICMAQANFGVGTMPFGSDFMLVLGVGFFLMGFVFIGRIWEFIRDPMWKGNVVAGKIIYWTLEIAVRVGAFIVIGSMQFLNGLFLYSFVYGLVINHITPIPLMVVYNSAIVVSFVAVFPLIYNIHYRLRDHLKRRDWVILVGFSLPWIILTVISLLLIIGVKLF